MEFRIAWWNTRLRYLMKNEDLRLDYAEHATKIINSIMQDHKCGMLLLGEVCEDSLSLLHKPVVEAGFEVIHLIDTATGQNFHMVAVYRSNSVMSLIPTFEVRTISGSRKKLAVRMLVELPDSTILHMFVVHWPSRLFHQEGTPERDEIAMFLRCLVDDIFESDEASNVILIGDFNDEPYARSISRCLMATKEPERLSRNRRLLYNPFWKQIVTTAQMHRGSSLRPSKGTYYYPSGKVDRWHVFDQMLFSAAFLNGDARWHLDERETHVIDDQFGLMTSLNNGTGFDHFPIMATIERRDNE